MISAAALAKEHPLLQMVQDGPVRFKSNMSHERFHRFLARNEDFRIERDKHGYVAIYPPITYDSSINEGEAFFALKLWAKQNPELGKVLSPSASFDLPDGSTHKADGAWVSIEKHNLLSADERKHIPALVPDFVMEVRSQTDSPAKLRRKMTEVWMENGVEVAFLLDPIREKAWVYRKGGVTEEYANFDAVITVGDLMPGFELVLKDLKND
ncbi:MAG: Uma2 family endonuclease [Saprospiraceae bacterium]|nr:Uma2 family endonuclease [Saprospiraceae bacterium]